MAEVKLNHLKKVDDGNVTAVYDFDINIKDGEFIVIVGPSGCGKSTTLRMIAGLEEITDGKAYVGEKDVTNLASKDRDMAMVFQNYALYAHMTIYQNMAFSLTLRKEQKEIIHKKVMAAAKILDLTSQLNKKPKQLSGGQRQRVAVGRAIVRNPKVFLFDEPLSNLDAKLRISLRQELKRLQRELKITTLYVTHDQDEAMTLSDRIAVFNNGYLEQVGTPYEIYNHSGTEFVCDFIGDINRLGEGILTEINAQTGANLDVNKTGFVRLERFLIDERENCAKLEGKIVDLEYSGMLVKYTIDVNGNTIRIVEKNDGRNKFIEEGQTLTVYVNPKDIMQY